ncbi:major facilitator superfamily domain-containing protein [Aspergillus karnatakaensis]|uniref:major facilitator superfamily domain-containing protein n=1 Tax=Aspergillus karnatakaensis TaxID=1810916 RepID=UPI003CCD36F6
MAELVKKDEMVHVEDVETGTTTVTRPRAMGTVPLTEGTIVYIPTPTADPQDPLNMPIWQKWVVLVVISTFSTIGLALVSGFGGLLGFYTPAYLAAGKGLDDITHLITYPTLFMGIGSLIGMPLAIGIGRRIVLLVSTVILVAGTILCAFEENYTWHLWARNVVALAAGQSEALVPMITQEIFFLHERSRALMGQQAIQVSLSAVWVLFAGDIADAITPQWWYGLGAALAGVQLVLTIFLVPETKYERLAASFQESDSAKKTDAEDAHCTERPPLDLDQYAPRTWRSDLRLWIGPPDWWKVLEQTFELLLFPNVFWALLLNGLALGTNIAIGTTYANILVASPYDWPNKSASYVNCGQIVVALVGIPLFGHGNDYIIKYFAKRNKGVYEPETRLISIITPIVIGTFTAVLYGQACEFPEQYHWFIFVWSLAAYYFCFVGVNIVSITYVLDSYPTRAGPLLVIICAFRGIISFGTSYGTVPFVDRSGYDGAFGTFGGLTAALGLCALPVFIWGKRIREVTGKWAKDQVVS